MTQKPAGHKQPKRKALSLRLPPNLSDKLARMATAQGISRNAVITGMIRRARDPGSWSDLLPEEDS